jgi:hypothetical protein
MNGTVWFVFLVIWGLYSPILRGQTNISDATSSEFYMDYLRFEKQQVGQLLGSLEDRYEYQGYWVYPEGPIQFKIVDNRYGLVIVEVDVTQRAFYLFMSDAELKELKKSLIPVKDEKIDRIMLIGWP